MTVAHLGDAALHDEEVRVVDVQLYRVKEILDAPAGAHRVDVTIVYMLSNAGQLLSTHGWRVVMLLLESTPHTLYSPRTLPVLQRR
jgi:hypothetical protein